jgi:gluconate 2-dehydrogenase gamma chain
LPGRNTARICSSGDSLRRCTVPFSGKRIEDFLGTLDVTVTAEVKVNPSLNRRHLLLRGSPAAVAALALTAVGNNPADGRASTTNSYVPKYFTADEWRFLNAAVERLIPSDGPGPGAIETGVPEFIDRQMETPYGHGSYLYLQGPFHPDAPPTLGYQLRYTPRELYRSGIAAADEACRRTSGKAFAALAAGDQDSFLVLLEKNHVQLSGPPAGVFFAQLLENTREGYFADPLYGGNRGMAAWKWIGFPGARADFTDWIDQAGKPYPYGPVAISGERG